MLGMIDNNTDGEPAELKTDNDIIQLSYTVTTAQANRIKRAIKKAKLKLETSEDDDTNANALELIAAEYLKK